MVARSWLLDGHCNPKGQQQVIVCLSKSKSTQDEILTESINVDYYDKPLSTENPLVQESSDSKISLRPLGPSHVQMPYALQRLGGTEVEQSLLLNLLSP